MSAHLQSVPMESEGVQVNLVALIDQGAKLYASGGLPRGSLPGWPSMDPLYSVAEGQWTVVTGIPQSGKSEWLDSMLVNLAEREPWEFCLYSPENWPIATHLIKLVEKRVRKPFNAGPTPRMTLREYRNAAIWVAEHFFWIEPELKTPDELIVAALSCRRRQKKFGIVLDPWNTLDHQRGGMTEHDYTSLILTEVTKLARASHAHVWLVVHPKKIERLRDGTRPVPVPYDISGSAHWYNKADNIICVHRDQLNAQTNQDVEIHVQKIRFKHIGHQGLALLKYDKVIGRYFELAHPSVNGELYADPERGLGEPREPGADDE